MIQKLQDESGSLPMSCVLMAYGPTLIREKKINEKTAKRFGYKILKVVSPNSINGQDRQGTKESNFGICNGQKIGLILYLAEPDGFPFPVYSAHFSFFFQPVFLTSSHPPLPFSNSLFPYLNSVTLLFQLRLFRQKVQEKESIYTISLPTTTITPEGFWNLSLSPLYCCQCYAHSLRFIEFSNQIL